MSETMTQKAQDERAKRLRATIQQVVDEAKSCEAPAQPSHAENPRELIHRRMAEISSPRPRRG